MTRFRVSLRNFIDSIYNKIDISREKAITNAISGFEPYKVKLSLYRGETQLDSVSLSALMCLAEVNRLGGKTEANQLFPDIDLPDDKNRFIGQVMLNLSQLGIIEYDEPMADPSSLGDEDPQPGDQTFRMVDITDYSVKYDPQTLNYL